jgi:hypothetical protein
MVEAVKKNDEKRLYVVTLMHTLSGPPFRIVGYRNGLTPDGNERTHHGDFISILTEAERNWLREFLEINKVKDTSIRHAGELDADTWLVDDGIFSLLKKLVPLIEHIIAFKPSTPVSDLGII